MCVSAEREREQEKESMLSLDNKRSYSGKKYGHLYPIVRHICWYCYCVLVLLLKTFEIIINYVVKRPFQRLLENNWTPYIHQPIRIKHSTALWNSSMRDQGSAVLF